MRLVSSPYFKHKIIQVCFSCWGRKPRNKKAKGETENA